MLYEVHTLDQEYRLELFCQLAQVMAEELPQIPLFAAAEATGHTERVDGVNVTIYDVPTWNAADWQIVE